MRGVGRWVRGRNRCGDRNWHSAAVELHGLTQVTGKMEKLGWCRIGGEDARMSGFGEQRKEGEK